jgi:LysM repeat protein
MTPARLLAPVALVAAAVALFVVVTSGSGDSATSSASPTPTVTAGAAARKKAKPTATASSGKTYRVEPGDTPSGIAAKLNVDVDALLAANPDADPNALTVGSELKIP